jgi:transcriptional regulator with XRE-family HTH domain
MSKSTRVNNKTPLVMNRLAIVLKEERKTNKWLANEIGFTASTVSKWATNTKQPSIFIFYMIALVLNRDLPNFFTSTEKITMNDKIKQLKILTSMVEKGKRTGKTKV